jgi:hypothetical protein
MRFIPWADYLYHSAFKNYSVLRIMIDICRRTTELVQHVTYGGSSHRRKGAARHIIAQVMLYCPPVSNGEEVGVLLVQIIFICLHGAILLPLEQSLY